MVVMAGGRLRDRGFDSRFGTFFFTPFFLFFSYLVCNFFSFSFFCLIFSPFFFLHAYACCSAISMLKHFWIPPTDHRATVRSNDTLVDTPFQLISGFFHVNQGVLCC